jgi:hypothetical protein
MFYIQKEFGALKGFRQVGITGWGERKHGVKWK